ncbi:MAG TPA: hypothetical protein VFE19_09800 [Jatrophihabitantaceae bacterium]|jgi:hypothetical protein|nr:hypothetical protein [Jatrophihabitantaceae bacterium]
MSTDRVVHAATPRPHLLRIYLNDHLAGAAGGTGLARRLAESHQGTAAGTDLVNLARDVEQDRNALLEIMRQLGIVRTYYKEQAATLAERAGRLKLNGSLLRRSPLSTVIELEAMVLGVTGKRCGWLSLRELAEFDTRLDAARLATLIERADQQLATLERLRVRAAREALAAS